MSAPLQKSPHEVEDQEQSQYTDDDINEHAHGGVAGGYLDRFLACQDASVLNGSSMSGANAKSAHLGGTFCLPFCFHFSMIAQMACDWIADDVAHGLVGPRLGDETFPKRSHGA